MRTFKDKKNTEWQISITIGTLRAVRDKCNLDLNNLMAPPQENITNALDDENITNLSIEQLQKSLNEDVLTQLSNDIILLVDTLYVLCSQQAAENSVTAEEFANRLDGKIIDTAFHALIDELIDFFPKTKAVYCKTVIQASRTAQQEVQKMMESTEFQKSMNTAMTLTNPVDSKSTNTESLKK
ncbi:hypothetical protein AAEX28_07090 [Lentisphaerota bacterium WC36G]|nr:hypothetical protein LJT99_09955 [Lentisphaerae bacterium WC36]